MMGLEMQMKITKDSSKELQERYGRKNFNRFLRAVAADLVVEIRLAAKHLIYDTPESPSYKRTWRLWNRIGAVVRGDGKITIESGVPYAKSVNDGTMHTSPRPYMDEGIKKFEKIVEKQAKIHFGEIRSR